MINNKGKMGLITRIILGILVTQCFLLPKVVLAQELRDSANPVSSDQEKLFQRLEELEKANTAQQDLIRSFAKEQERLRQRVEELEAMKMAPQDAIQQAAPGLSHEEQEGLQQRAEEKLTAKTAQDDSVREDAIRTVAKEQEQLKQRVEELEITKIAQEDATRWIVQDAFSKLETKINKYVGFGGTLEMTAGWSEDFSGPAMGDLQLSTAQLDFEVQVNDWSKGSLIFEYINNTSTLFPTTAIFNAGGGDRVTIDTASLTIGDPQKFPPSVTFGQVILPFGISTGNPVVDVQSIESPLTIEVFEMRNTALGFGLEFPTPALVPPPKPVSPPPVKPLLINPVVSSLSRNLGYTPPPTRPPSPIYVTPLPTPPTFKTGIYFYDGSTSGWTPGQHIDATVGFRTKGNCGLSYEQRYTHDQLTPLEFFCPWSFNVDIDFNSSVFESRFLVSEYAGFLDQIGFVPGMAAHVKASIGPVSLIGEWNGAIKNATFFDDADNFVNIKPGAWQIYLGHQFDWNPWVEEIGAQGTFISLGYSQSYDLAGVTQLVNDEPNRVGFVPRSRFLVTVSEWLLDGVRFSVEYSHIVDYSEMDGGTGNSANGVFSQITYAW